MENLEFFRRKRNTKGQWACNSKPMFKIEMTRGTFVIFKKVAQLLKAGKGDAVMFAFNKKDCCGYIFKEDVQPDSYILGNSGREYYRFTSKELMLFFIEVFSINEPNTAYFEVTPVPNNKGMYKFTYSH
jgi:hypothetical protein